MFHLKKILNYMFYFLFNFPVIPEAGYHVGRKIKLKIKKIHPIFLGW
jgi:hypothetical protein